MPGSLHAVADDLVASLRDLRFAPPVACVYNPLEYARAPYRSYVARYGAPPRPILIVGMNPGPWGMAQTGVPFGDVACVRDWLGIEEPVGQPPVVIASRPVSGFACTRREVSGTRLWGWARASFGTPRQFFARCFVVNYCPLLFFDAQGRNLTPDRLRKGEQAPLLSACDAALRRSVELMAARRVIAVGRFAFERSKAALSGVQCAITMVAHPSPANPAANRGWHQLMSAALADSSA